MRTNFTKEQATQMLVEQDLDFLDLCVLVLAYADRTKMQLRWTHPAGVTVQIKQPRKKASARAV